MKISMPENVKMIIERLEKSGFDAYIVGGCVRDAILGIEPKDWDITTSAKTSDIKSYFSDFKLQDNGEKHGTVGVIIDGYVYEITTFRIDGEYNDNRHPDNVEFTDRIEEDLKRRDFTVNAIAYNERKGIVDPFNGEKDLSLKALRCVGNPDERFREDALRILRALRFASVYNFSIEVETACAMVRNRSLLNNIAVERISSEFNKIICGNNIGYILRRYKDIVAVIFPEIVSTFEFEQNNPHHNKTVWKQTTTAVANIEPDLLLRMVMLLHDIGKPISLETDSNNIDHFKNHNRFSMVYAKSALERLKYPTSFIDNVVLLIEYHNVHFSDNKRQIKHILNKIGVDNFKKLLLIQRADILSQSKYKREFKLNNITLAQNALNLIISNDECFNLKKLAINGSDLLHLGITDGKTIGYILENLLDSVIDETIENDNILLKKRALEIINQI